MKKILIFLVITTTLFSCDNSHKIDFLIGTDTKIDLRNTQISLNQSQLQEIDTVSEYTVLEEAQVRKLREEIEIWSAENIELRKQIEEQLAEFDELSKEELVNTLSANDLWWLGHIKNKYE